MTAMVGCNRWAELGPASDVPPEDHAADGGLTMATGESIHILINGVHDGFETLPFRCEELPTLTASDPSIAAIAPWNGENTSVNGFDVYAYGFVVTGLRAGEVILTGLCSEHHATKKLTVRP